MKKSTLDRHVRLFQKKFLFLQKLLIWKNDLNNTKLMKNKFQYFFFKNLQILYSVNIFFILHTRTHACMHARMHAHI